jgi:hypothetical protein
MPEYRAYLLNDLGRVSRAAIFIRVETDREAIETAKQFTAKHDIELWQAARRVAILKPELAAPPRA